MVMEEDIKNLVVGGFLAPMELSGYQYALASLCPPLILVRL
jgi:hypothetical protein